MSVSYHQPRLEGESGKVLAAALANLGASSRGPSPAVTQPLGAQDHQMSLKS